MEKSTERTTHGRKSGRVRIRKKKTIGGVSKKNKGGDPGIINRKRPQGRPRILSQPIDTQGMRTLEDWLPGRSPEEKMKEIENETEGTAGETSPSKGMEEQKGMQQQQQQVVTAEEHKRLPQQIRQPTEKSSKRTLSDTQMQRSTASESAEGGDTLRLLEEEGEQLSQPKRQRRITDYTQMLPQKSEEKQKLDGETSIKDNKYSEEKGRTQTLEGKSSLEDMTPVAPTPTL